MSKWTSSDGAEINSCCVLTTEPNDLIKPLHHRMPVVVPIGYEEEWTIQKKNYYELREFTTNSDGLVTKWLDIRTSQKIETTQLNLFN